MPKPHLSFTIGFWLIVVVTLSISQWLRIIMGPVGVLNHGLAFSIALPTYLIFVIMVLFLIVMVWLFFFRRQANWLWSVALGLVVGGGASNLLDRVILSGGVLDYWSLGGLSMINLADIAITCGILVAAIMLLSPTWNQK